MPAAVTERAPAKVNLQLRILGLEPDGYHRLETIFQALELHDSLDAAPADDTSLVVEGDVDVGPPERNLVLRAAHAFRAAVPHSPHATFRLVKRIPSGAGLGGGSSDAAAALRALNTLAGAPLAADALRELGATLGSDVAFFLCGSPLASATGRGERLTPWPPLPAADVLVVDPAFPVATRDAFRWWDEGHLAGRVAAAPARTPNAPGPARPDRFDALGSLARNDFESVVFERHPELRRVRDALLEAGASVALLSGSGSCVFGLFDGAPPPREAEERLRAVLPGARVLHTRTLA